MGVTYGLGVLQADRGGELLSPERLAHARVRGGAAGIGSLQKPTR